MLVLRIGTIESPIPLKCSYCPRETEGGEVIHFMETDPINQRVLEEYETMCPACYIAIKDAAIKHKVPIEFDLAPTIAPRVAQTDELKVREF